MDRFQAMETFVRVVESGSFSAAARHLGVGQPAVSKAIVILEARLGVRLLVRSTRQLRPTEAGQAFYERALRVLDEADEAESAARGLGAGLEGRLRVCAPLTFARLHIAPRLASFLAQHPKLQLDLVMDDRNIDLLEERIDVALRMGDLKDSSLTARKISEGERYIVASTDYLARRGAPMVPADLTAHDIIVYTQSAGGDEWRMKKGSGESSVHIASRLTFTAAEGVREAVIAGLGLAIVSQWMMPAELAAGTVVPVLSDWTLPSIDLWAVFPSGRLPSAKARAFINWFEVQFSESRSLSLKDAVQSGATPGS
jgi:DNA-binding transcriptional LysR family regulator